MSAHVLMNLLNKLNKFNIKYRSMNVRFYLSYDIKSLFSPNFFIIYATLL